MNKEKRDNLELRTNKAFGIEVRTQQIDPRYKLVLNDNPLSTESGDLRLLSIEPQQPGLPRLSGRWDHNDNTLDIDLIRNGRTEKNFQGHHTVRDAQGVYHIDVVIPEGNVFTGTLSMGTELGLLLKDSMRGDPGLKS
jgi:hypothetical protein